MGDQQGVHLPAPRGVLCVSSLLLGEKKRERTKMLERVSVDEQDNGRRRSANVKSVWSSQQIERRGIGRCGQRGGEMSSVTSTQFYTRRATADRQIKSSKLSPNKIRLGWI